MGVAARSTLVGRLVRMPLPVVVIGVPRVLGIPAVGETSVDGAVRLLHQERPDQSVVGELDLLQRQADSQKRVVAQLAGPVEPGSGDRERIPGASLPILLTVLDRVQQVSDTAEQTPRLA